MASKKASASSPVSRGDGRRQIGRGEGTGRDDHAVPVVGRPRDFAAFERDERMRGQRRRHRGRKAVAVDRQRAARRHLVGIGGAHHQRAEPAHFLVQQPDRVVVLVVGAERIRADQFGLAVGLVRGGCAKGRISCSVTGTPACASCQAASEPASPPPTTWTVFNVMAGT